MLKNLKAGIIISVAVEILREILELIFYGEVQLRTVDNIIYIALVASLYTNYMLGNDLKEAKQMMKLNGKPMLKCEHCIHKKICIDGANYRNAEACRNYINENDIAPAADVVPVIRCKDCKYYPLCCLLSDN